jgi:uncharacterized protein
MEATAMSDDSHATADGPSLGEVQLALGQISLDRREYGQAIDHFTAVARAGDARGYNMLGRIHERGWGVFPDMAWAAAYYRRAAEMGDVWAKFNLADLLCRGDGVERDDAAAFALYLDAAGGGHLKSLNMLGLFFEEGRSVDQDLAKARDLFRAGAEGGDCWACLNHARFLLTEDRVQDAAAFLSRAIETGFPDVYRHIADRFMGHSDPRMARIARHARELASSEGAKRDDPS